VWELAGIPKLARSCDGIFDAFETAQHAVAAGFEETDEVRQRDRRYPGEQGDIYAFGHLGKFSAD